MNDHPTWEASYEEKSKTKKIWWTKDIAIASFMAVAIGKIRLLGTEPIDRSGKLRYFIFEDNAQNDECEALKQDYLFERPTTKVIARLIMDQFRAFRTLSYQ